MDNQKLLLQLSQLLEANRAEIELANTQDTWTSHSTNIEDMERGLATIEAYAHMDIQQGAASTGVAIYSCYGDPSFGLFGMTLAPAILACGNQKPIVIGFPSILKNYFAKIQDIITSSQLFPNIQFVLGRKEFCKGIEDQELIRDIVIFGDAWVNQCMAKAIGEKKRMVFYGLGNNASVIMASANLELAVEKTLKAAFVLNGQAAVCINRCLIDSRIDREEIRAIFEKQLAKIGYGPDAMKETNYVTPIRIQALVDYTQQMVDELVTDSSQLINYKVEKIGEGSLMQPALVWECNLDSKLMKSYKFAPVLPVSFVDADAISKHVNSTEFGIYVNYWGDTNDVEVLKKQSSDTHIFNLENESILDVIHPDKGYVGPWGGYKYSGFVLNEESDWKPLDGAFNLIELLQKK